MAEEYGKWISVKEKLPWKCGDYLYWFVLDGDAGYETCQFSQRKFWCYGDSTKYVTHWMRLPSPPVE